MGEQIISASGIQYGLVIDDQGRAKVDATVTTSVTTGSDSYIYGKSGANWIPALVDSAGKLETTTTASVTTGSEQYIMNWGELGSDRTISNMVAGSIVYMPSVNVSTGSEQWIQNFGDIGSVRVIDNFPSHLPGSVSQVTTPWIVLGSVYVDNQISEVTVGSESWIQNFGELGSTVVVDNLYAGSESWVKEVPKTETYISGLSVGSIISMPEINVTTGSENYIQNWGELGSSRVITNLYAGSEVYQGTFPWTGSIISMPDVSVTAGSEQWIKGGSVEVYTGSIYVTNFAAGTGYAGSDSYIPAGSVIITNLVAGSIVSQPDINVTTGSENWIMNFGDLGSSRVVTNLYTGSQLYQGERYGVSGIVEVNNRVAGSIVNIPNVTINDASTIGSYTTQNILGSVAITSPISVTAGSESWIKGGSLIAMGMSGAGIYPLYTDDTGTLNVNAEVTTGSEVWIKGGSTSIYDLGSNAWVYINSGTQYVDVATGSIYVTNFAAGTGYAGSDAYIPAGSVIVTNTVNVEAGSIVYQGTTPWVGSIISMPDVGVTTGSENWIQNFNVLGSDRVITNFSDLGSSRIVSNLYAGSEVYQGTNPWQIAGSIWSMPDINVSTGSEQYIQNFGDLGSSRVITNFGVLGSSRVVTNLYAGSKVYSGDFYTGSKFYQEETFGVSGIVEVSNRVAGSIVNMPVIAGSFVVTNPITDVGSPSFKRGILTASGTYTNVWPIGGAGSRLEIHGYHISTNNPGYVRLCRSGTTPVVISDWNLNYVSGATIEKTFVNPIIPNAANVPVGIGATVVGSTLCTIYGREIK